jgi:uncharacterized protein YcbK (DUF882 family)
MYLTDNFKKSEFDSKDGAKMPEDVLVNVTKLACNLQRLRDVLNRPISINSGYRSPSHNEAVGGVKDSYHTKGMAADIVVKGLNPKQVANAIESLILSGDMLQGGIGIYDTFVHYDFRKKRARW